MFCYSNFGVYSALLHLLINAGSKLFFFTGRLEKKEKKSVGNIRISIGFRNVVKCEDNGRKEHSISIMTLLNC